MEGAADQPIHALIGALGLSPYNCTRIWAAAHVQPLGEYQRVSFDLLCLATAIPVHVTDTVRTAAETDWALFYMTLGGTVASAAVAVFTAVLAMRTSALAGETKRMADKTGDLAKETLDSVNIARAGTAVADQHHQESQAPILVMSSITFRPSDLESDEYAVVALRYSIRNIGFGPALESDITITFEHGRVTSLPDSIGEIAPGERIPAGQKGFEVTSHLHFPDYQESDIPWRSSIINISVQYRSVFGGVRTTKYFYEYDHEDARTGFPYRFIGTTISPQTIVTRKAEPATGVLRNAIEE